MTTGLYKDEIKKSKFDLLNEKVLQWAKEKGILEKANSLTQIEKTIEEVNETKEAIIANDRHEVIDGFGDILVTVLIGCKLQEIDPLDALETAYNVISKRQGKMINGTFVKE